MRANRRVGRHWHDAMIELSGDIVAELEAAGVRVERGVFGAKMDVSLTNSGPFTLIVDSDDLAGPRRGC